MTSDTTPTQWQEWRRHWPYVLAAFMGNSLATTVWASIGLFIDPLTREFGWSRTEITAGVSVMSLVMIPLTPFIGAIIDRYGGRRVAVPGLIMTMTAISALSLANGSTTQWVFLWCLLGLANSTLNTTIWIKGVMERFVIGRSVAMAAVMAGMYFAGAVAPSYAQWMIDTYGWRVAFMGFGFGWGGVALLLCLLFLKDANRSPGQPRTVQDQLATGLTVREAVRSVTLYRIAAATVIVYTVGAALLIHKAPILIEAGISRADAAKLVGLSGLSGIGGKMLTAWAMQRWNAGKVSGVTIGLMGLALIFLLKPFATPTTIVISMMAIGFASGAKLQIAAYLTSIYVGQRHYGKIFGAMVGVLTFGGGLGPVLGGLAYDVAGNYSTLIYAGIPLCLIGWMLLLGLGKYPDWSIRPSAEAETEPAGKLADARSA